MRKLVLLFSLLLILLLAGGLLLWSRSRQAERLTILADGEPVTLISGENVDPVTFELAKEDPAALANAHWVLVDDMWKAVADTSLPLDAAHTTLHNYFNALNESRYGEASRFFAGDWVVLEDMNPEIDPGSKDALFEAACTVNGFLCNLQIDEVVETIVVSETEFRFLLTFKHPDGTPFELGPCCGEDPESSPPIRIFEFTVQAQADGYRVLDLPVYSP